jgi:elongation factor P
MNITTGRSWRQRFTAESELEEVPVERKPMSFLYEDADRCWFMNTATFEQIGLPSKLVGRRRPFLREGMPISIAFVDDEPVRVVFDEVVDARVAFVFPPDRPQSAWKRATLENGVGVSVPLFVESGDAVRIHTGLLTALAPRKTH